MVRPVGVEPTTYGLEVRCSIQLSYRRKTQKHYNNTHDFFIEIENKSNK